MRGFSIGSWIFPVMGISLAVTLLAELAFAVILKLRDRHELILITAVNVLTNPAVVAGYYLISGRMAQTRGSTWIWVGSGRYGIDLNRLLIWTLELAAIAAEALCYRTCSRRIRHPWLFSAGANLFSYWIGAGIQRL